MLGTLRVGRMGLVFALAGGELPGLEEDGFGAKMLSIVKREFEARGEGVCGLLTTLPPPPPPPAPRLK